MNKHIPEAFQGSSHVIRNISHCQNIGNTLCVIPFFRTQNLFSVIASWRAFGTTGRRRKCTTSECSAGAAVLTVCLDVSIGSGVPFFCRPCVCPFLDAYIQLHECIYAYVFLFVFMYIYIYFLDVYSYPLMNVYIYQEETYLSIYIYRCVYLFI